VCTKRVLCVAPGVLRRQCREYGPLERSCGSRCKRKLPVLCFVSHSQTSCICCVHHQTPAERETYRGEIVLEISENQLSGVLSCCRFLENLGHIWKTNSTLSAATCVVTHHHHHGGLAGRLRHSGAIGWELEEAGEPEWPGLTMEVIWRWLKNEVLQ